MHLMIGLFVGFIAQMLAYGFLALVWSTRRQRNIASMFFLKPAYFILNPLFRPAGLNSQGQRYRLAAIFCFGIMIVTIGMLPILAQPLP